jgi:hypothetical protein
MKSGETYLWHTSLYDLVYLLENQTSCEGRPAWTCRMYRNFQNLNTFHIASGRVGSGSGDPSAMYDGTGIVFEDTIKNLCELRTGLELLDHAGRI